MTAQRLVDTIDAVTRAQRGVAPPVAPEIFAGGTRLTGRWVNEPFDAYVPPMIDHVLVNQLSGSGDAWMRSDGKFRRMPSMPGTITLVPRGQDSERVTTVDLEVSHVYLSHDRLRLCAEQAGHGRDPELIDRLNVTDARMSALLGLLLQEVELREAASTLFIEQVLDLVCTHVLRAHAVFSLSHAAPRRGLAPWQVKRVTAYMHDNLDKDIGLQELADLVHLSRFYFCGAFRMATGYTPYEWLTRLRLQEARRLLANQATPIADIARAIGYQSPAAFSAVFRRSIGTTPRAFRRDL